MDKIIWIPLNEILEGSGSFFIPPMSFPRKRWFGRLTTLSEVEADYIVSGDRHLLDVGQYQGIKIMNAQAFLNIWQKQPNT